LGHKVHPIGFRLGIIQDWQAKWYADAHYAESLQEDLKLRQAIESAYAEASISLVQIDRQAKEVTVTIHTARPGIVIGRGGQRVDELRLRLEKLIGKRIRLNIQEIRQAELDANLVAKTIAEQIQRRVAYRRTMKQAIFRTIQAGAKGIRVSCSGRLGDAEIARRQTMHQGQVPLHTIRADIDYGFTEARTTLGRIGVKVWIYKGEILPEPKRLEVEEIPEELAVSKGAEVELPTAAEPEEKPAEPVAVETAEVIPEVKAEEKPAEKPAKPRARRVKKPVAAEPEEKPAEPVAAETVEVAPEVKPEKKPVKARKRVKKPVAAEPEEKPAEPVAVETAEVAVKVKAEKKPVKARKRVKKPVAAEPEEKPAEPVAVESAKVVPEVKPEKKPVKARGRVKKAVTAEPEEKPAEPVAVESAEVAVKVKAEKKPVKTRRSKKITPTAKTGKEEKDATT